MFSYHVDITCRSSERLFFLINDKNLSSLTLGNTMKSDIDLSGLLHYAKIFYSLPVKDQDSYTKKNIGVSAITFRRWLKAAHIKKTSSAEF